MDEITSRLAILELKPYFVYLKTDDHQVLRVQKMRVIGVLYVVSVSQNLITHRLFARRCYVPVEKGRGLSSATRKARYHEGDDSICQNRNDDAHNCIKNCVFGTLNSCLIAIRGGVLDTPDD